MGLPVGRLGRICWCCAPARWSCRVRDCRSHLVISRSHLRPLQLPAETFEELLLWFTNKQQQGFRIILSRLVVRVGVVVINGLRGHIGATQRVTLHSLGRWHLVSEVPTEKKKHRASIGLRSVFGGVMVVVVAIADYPLVAPRAFLSSALHAS